MLLVGCNAKKMLEFARNASVLELWQRSPLTPTPFCTTCACALFAKPQLARPVQIIMLTLIILLQHAFSMLQQYSAPGSQVGMQCSMHQAGSCSTKSIKLSLALLKASCCLLLCYSYQAGSMMCIRHQCCALSIICTPYNY